MTDSKWRWYFQRFHKGAWSLYGPEGGGSIGRGPSPFFRLGVELILAALEVDELGSEELASLRLGISMLPAMIRRVGKSGSKDELLYLLPLYDPRFAAMTHEMQARLIRQMSGKRGRTPNIETQKLIKYVESHKELGSKYKSGGKGIRKKIVDTVCHDVFGSIHSKCRPHTRRFLRERFPVKLPK